MSNTFSPPWTPLERLDSQLKERGFAALQPADVCRWASTDPASLADLRADWEGLPPDEYLRDGGNYRRRRHACFVVDGPEVQQTPQRPHWQPVQYNALHGGMQRWFAPMLEGTVSRPAWQGILKAMAGVASALRGPQPWFVEAHQFRIDTTDGIGRPTPEGAHRDGVDLVAVFLVGREGIKGGETRVFEADGPAGQRFTLAESWSLLLLDDPRMIHESTPIQPLGEQGGHRDTLVLTCRAGGFQGDGVV
ncbi:2OG-Fe dioxygenase family protein [Xylophilus sp. GOD-11R]|uniref:2OG-Fe dioxygenase family protein n=1 Tax=Xylophilus sp. GOD-11R TaxID=3089814 RepID=UPI00298BF677|nr:2OG-Fe dioxygenase family protein [Xylophilus sp. GOD-11R]WPB59172.1 2OG-Fe dioxygenase family protein [Xylophilus sp. GOD-11R]